MKSIVIAVLMTLLAACSSTPKKVDNGIAPDTQARLQAWQQLIASGKQWSDAQRLTASNDFINQLNFVDDSVHWQQQDYWATPLQTLVTKGGDCEDFSIAKYFTLTAMGMDEDKLRMVYVKALTIDQAHMIVAYYPEPGHEPLVLDNLNKLILPASQRTDLMPAYSFNGKGLWLAKQDYSGQKVDDSERVSLWKSVLQKMDVEAAERDQHICLYQYYDLEDQLARTQCSN